MKTEQDGERLTGLSFFYFFHSLLLLRQLLQQLAPLSEATGSGFSLSIIALTT